jgi:predicted transcriptional regulator
MNPINEALRMARLGARIKQQDLAKRLDVSAAFLSEVESGHAKLPKEWYPFLPTPIRRAVAQAAIDDLKRQEEALRRFLK